MKLPSWLSRAARNRHRHAIEQASRRWRGGLRDDSARTRRKILISTQAGTIKMNIDTDTQWSFWDGIREYEAANHDYLQAQIGNPDGADKPNKKYYDPRMCLRSAEEATVERLGLARRVNQLSSMAASVRAIDAAPARRRGGAVLRPRAWPARASSSSRDEHPTHRLVCTQARRWRT